VQTQSHWPRVFIAVLLPFIAWYLQWRFWNVLQPFVWFLFYPAVFFSSWAAGPFAGIVATITSILIVWYGFIPPQFTFATPTFGNLLSAVLFALMGGLFSLAHHRLLSTTQRLTETIDALTRSDEARRGTEARFRALIEHGHDSITLTDQKGAILYTSPAVTAVEGYRPDEIMGRSIFEQTHPDDLPSMHRLMNQLAATPGKPLPFACRKHHREGHWLVVEGFATNLLQDPYVGAIVTNYRDVTDHRLGELAAARLAALVESSADAIIGQDLASIVTSWNQGATDVFGYEAHEIVGKSIMRVIPVERLHEEATLVSRMTAGEDVRQFETKRTCKDGRVIDVSITLSAIRDPSGAIVGASKIVRDITAAKQAQEYIRSLNLDLERRVQARTAELERAKERAEAADQHKSEFLANMSHELRTPLNAIIGFSQLMSRGKVGPLLPTQAEYLGDIHSSAKHLLRLINDVLDLTKVESGQMAFHPEPVDTVELVEEVRTSVRELIAGKGQELLVYVDPAVQQVTVDAVRTKQVLYNYLSNAIKFTPENGRIECRVVPDSPGRFRIEVSDTGIGISQEQQAQLFERFSQLHAGAAKLYQGTGLGLALTKQLVEAQGGSVAVESQAGIGSTFSATLLSQPAESSNPER
jgi:PAS domain S-box-containing protein